MNTKLTTRRIKSILKKLISVYRKQEQDNKKTFNREMEDNAINEALEAKLALMIAQSPSSQQMNLRLELPEFGPVSVYSGCQVAGPQVA